MKHLKLFEKIGVGSPEEPKPSKNKIDAMSKEMDNIVDSLIEISDKCDEIVFKLEGRPSITLTDYDNKNDKYQKFIDNLCNKSNPLEIETYIDLEDCSYDKFITLTLDIKPVIARMSSFSWNVVSIGSNWDEDYDGCGYIKIKFQKK
jgi:hypothetical protein